MKRKYEHHLKSYTSLYNIWRQMRQRCNNPKDESYHWYGGRGIKVCWRWNYSFIEFQKWALSHGYKEGLTIDRIDINKGYQPTNCQWLSRSDNSKKAHAIDRKQLTPEELEYRNAKRKYNRLKKMYDEVVADMIAEGKDPSQIKKPVPPEEPKV